MVKNMKKKEESKIWFGVFIIMSFITFDIVMTIIALKTGNFQEMNPIMKIFFEKGLIGVIEAYSLCLILITGYVFIVDSWIKQKPLFTFLIAMPCFLEAITIINNFKVIFS